MVLNQEIYKQHNLQVAETPKVWEIVLGKKCCTLLILSSHMKREAKRDHLDGLHSSPTLGEIKVNADIIS